MALERLTHRLIQSVLEPAQCSAFSITASVCESGLPFGVCQWQCGPHHHPQSLPSSGETPPPSPQLPNHLPSWKTQKNYLNCVCVCVRVCSTSDHVHVGFDSVQTAVFLILETNKLSNPLQWRGNPSLRGGLLEMRKNELQPWKQTDSNYSDWLVLNGLHLYRS